MSTHVDTADTGFRLLPRPRNASGLVDWLTTVDHKKIAYLYGFTAIFFFFVGGLEALLIRTQLAFPDAKVVSAATFNQLFTMHGTTMIFLVVMPMSVAFFNYIIPLQIGARDVAFPRLNAFSYWMFVAGGLMLNVSWFLGAAPDAGWFGYANLTEKPYSPGHNTDFWILGLQILGISSLVGALNFIVTIINMRAPGMTMMRLPVFCWMTLVTGFLIILAFPVITIALLELMMDRVFNTNFFQAAKGGLPILWQHLFWVFGHPEVYILILPAMGIVSEILPTFSRKPLFGYPIVVFSGVAIGFLGFTVWSHHMFTTGLGAVANTAFALTTMAIAVPTGVKIFNWLGTVWGGQVRFRTPLLYAIGFVTMFMIGGFSGLTHAAPPGDAQQQDTYYVVAHFHYVLIGGALMGLIGGLYYWFPKFSGRMFRSQTLGRLGFWALFIGFNVTFFPMHWLGLNGMPRRIYTYSAGYGWEFWNLVCTIGAYLMLLSFFVIIADFVRAWRDGLPAPADPWDGRTLEWAIPSPPPVYNFEKIPHVIERDDLWMRKYPHLMHHGEEGDADAAAAHADEHGADAAHAHHDEDGIHMPDQSWFPLWSAAGFFVAALIFLFWGGPPQPERSPAMLTAAIAALTFGIIGIYGWSLEGPAGYHIHPEVETHE